MTGSYFQLILDKYLSLSLCSSCESIWLFINMHKQKSSSRIIHSQLELNVSKGLAYRISLSFLGSRKFSEVRELHAAEKTTADQLVTSRTYHPTSSRDIPLPNENSNSVNKCSCSLSHRMYGENTRKCSTKSIIWQRSAETRTGFASCELAPCYFWKPFSSNIRCFLCINISPEVFNDFYYTYSSISH